MNSIQRTGSLAIAAAMAAGCSSIPVGNAPMTAEIRRTAYGIPHIKADTEAGIGYGSGYVLAQDHFCTMTSLLITARGERSKYYGIAGRSASGQDNLHSDVFFKWLASDARVDAFWKAQPPELQALFQGAAAGINRYMRDHPPEQRSPLCAKEPWLQKVSAEDLVRHHLATVVGLSLSTRDLAQGIASATPPLAVASRSSVTPQGADPISGLPDLPEGQASNAVAFGKEHTRNGSGMLFGNPHLLWQGSTRLHVVHLTRPGVYDVLGSTLPGYIFPFVGFNRHVAWTGTVSAAQRFTYFALKLDPADPTRYFVDGVAERMTPRQVQVDAVDATGKPTRTQHFVWESRFGPVLSTPGSFAWTRERAFAVRDANIDNYRVVQQYRGIALAASVGDIRDSLTKVLGSYVLQVTAADDQGQAFFGSIGPAPDVSDAQLARCVLPEFKALLPAIGVYPRPGIGLPVLDGSRLDCNWQTGAGSRFPGLVAGERMPSLLRTDFVQNSNDGSWLTQPARPLTGFPQLVSRSEVPLGWRARMGLTQIADRFAGRDGHAADGKVDPALWVKVALTHRVLVAERHLDSLLSVCSDASELQAACAVLRRWDRKAELDSAGYLLFERVWQTVGALGGDVWTPYDASDPLSVRVALRVAEPAVRAQVRTAFGRAVQSLASQGMPLDARLADYQFSKHGAARVPIFGGPEGLGIYGRMDTVPATGPESRPGERRGIGGATHIQAVDFDANGPRNLSFLAQSQSADPRSPHVDDLTQLLARKQPVSFPYREDEIKADPQLTVMRISE